MDRESRTTAATEVPPRAELPLGGAGVVSASERNELLKQLLPIVDRALAKWGDPGCKDDARHEAVLLLMRRIDRGDPIEDIRRLTSNITRSAIDLVRAENGAPVHVPFGAVDRPHMVYLDATGIDGETGFLHDVVEDATAMSPEDIIIAREEAAQRHAKIDSFAAKATENQRVITELLHEGKSIPRIAVRLNLSIAEVTQAIEEALEIVEPQEPKVATIEESPERRDLVDRRLEAQVRFWTTHSRVPTDDELAHMVDRKKVQAWCPKLGKVYLGTETGEVTDRLKASAKRRTKQGRALTSEEIDDMRWELGLTPLRVH